MDLETRLSTSLFGTGYGKNIAKATSRPQMPEKRSEQTECSRFSLIFPSRTPVTARDHASKTYPILFHILPCHFGLIAVPFH